MLSEKKLSIKNKHTRLTVGYTFSTNQEGGGGLDHACSAAESLTGAKRSHIIDRPQVGALAVS